jgi:hypothetical protein
MQRNDATQPEGAEHDRPNRQSNTEKAEGSRENQEGRETATADEGGELTEEAVGQPDDQAGGISNRPFDEEQERQEPLPPRGERRENWKED